MTSKQRAINKAARRLSHWAKDVVELGPQGAPRYLMLDMLRKDLNRTLRGLPAKKAIKA
jgi:hypothetical protein